MAGHGLLQKDIAFSAGHWQCQLQSSCRPVTHCDFEGRAHATACQQFGRFAAAKLQDTRHPPSLLLPLFLRIIFHGFGLSHRRDADRKFKVKFELGSVS